MMKIKKFNDLRIKYDSLHNFIILAFIITLYAYYEKRLYVEAVFIVVFGVYYITKKKRPTLYTLWNLIFLGVSLMSVLWSVNPSASLQMARKILEIGIIGNLLIAYLDNKDKMLFLYKAFVWAGIALIIRLLISFPISMWGKDRIGDSILNANAIGLHLAISAIFAFYLARAVNQKKYYLFIVLFFIVISLTGSRKAFVMLVMGISLVYYFNSNKLTKKVKSVFFATACTFIVYSMIMTIPSFYEILGFRIEALVEAFIGEGHIDTSTRLRESMIDIGLLLFKNNPLLGYGIATYGDISGFGMYSHNNYIELLVGVGLTGTAVYYFIYIYLIKNLYPRKLLLFGNPILVIILVLMLMEYGLVSYYTEIYQIIIILGYAVVKVQRSQSKQIKKTDVIS